MAIATQPKWPIAVFVATILSGLLSTGGTIAYYQYTNKVQEQEKEIAERQARYKAEVEALRGRLVISKTVQQEIETPITTTERVCTKLPLPFGNNQICTNVPKVQLEKRQVSAVVQAEDPTVKAELDVKLKDLEALSSAAVKTQTIQADLKSLVETSRQLVAPLISLLVSVASLIVILSRKYKNESEKWAYGTLGTVLGFWLK
jgi:hypothetical protein